MIKKKIILSILIFTMSLYVCHDLLPYHNHGMNHFDFGHNHEQVIKNIEAGEHHCDGHELCVTCMLKERLQIQINHLKIDLSVNPTNMIIKVENVKVSADQLSFLFQHENSHRYKSKFIRQAHSLRAPPFLV